MELIIQEVAETISISFEDELKKLLSGGGDISEFILASKEMLDGIGVKLVAEALETLDQAVKESRDRKRNWVVKSKDDLKNLVNIFGEVKKLLHYLPLPTTDSILFLMLEQNDNNSYTDLALIL